MRVVLAAVLLAMLAVMAGKMVAMLPPDTFREPIFASTEAPDDEGSVTEFA